MILRLVAGVLVALVIQHSAVRADVVYESAPLNPLNIYGGGCSPCTSYGSPPIASLFDKFSLESAATIRSASFFAQREYFNNATIRFSIFNNAGISIFAHDFLRSQYTISNPYYYSAASIRPFYISLPNIDGLTLDAGTYTISFFGLDGFLAPLALANAPPTGFQTSAANNNPNDPRDGGSGFGIGFGLYDTPNAPSVIIATPGPIAGAGVPAFLGLAGIVAWRRRRYGRAA